MLPHLLIREYYSCFNERRFTDGADLFADDSVFEHPQFSESRRGREGYLEHARSWVEAFPDGLLNIHHVEQRGDTICEVDLIGTGTHSGDLNMGGYGTFKATGAKTTLRYREMLEIRGGKITYSSVVFNLHDLVRQLSGKGDV